jgi:hypothetical protein
MSPDGHTIFIRGKAEPPSPASSWGGQKPARWVRAHIPPRQRVAFLAALSRHKHRYQVARRCDRASEFDLSLALTLHGQEHIADPSLMRADAVIYPGFAMSLPIATYLRAAQEKGLKL